MYNKLDGVETTIPIYSEVCLSCRHFHRVYGKRECAAFPEGIPMEIWMGENDHRSPVDGDHGIQFEDARKPSLAEAS